MRRHRGRVSSSAGRNGALQFVPGYESACALCCALSCVLALTATPGRSAESAAVSDPPRVVSISPAAAELPANVLRFYVTFSRPMREGREVLGQIRLLDDAGRDLPAPWRDLDLWNDDATRLSLFVHPGRVKQGVNLRVEQGPVLEPGRRYTLVVDAGLRDTRGVPLAGPFEHAFSATAELHERIDPTAWRWSPPAPGGMSPLDVAFDRPLDQALVARALRVHDAAGRPVAGRGGLSPDGRRWRFVPAGAWHQGALRLAVDPVLEDVCGNTPARAFDVDRGAVATAAAPVAVRAESPIPIGSRRELFIDDVLIASLQGARRELKHPVPREIAITHDAPWEGAGSGYHTVINDGELFRLYYRGSPLGVVNGRLVAGPEVYCYAESRDGLRFTRPELGLHEHGGSTKNNIILTGVGSHNFAPFLDTRPDCPPASRFKALGGLPSEGGLFAFHSADGIRWSRMRDEPVVTKGAFDSQNLAFWDPTAGVYRAYFRTFTAGITTSEVWKPEGFRAIRTATSQDFLKWENEADLAYPPDALAEHLYTNQVAPYFRAPHLLVGFPTRYVERGWSEAIRALPQLADREQRAAGHVRYGTALTEGLLMASRDGVHFQRWAEAFLRPGPERPETWNYGHQFIAWHAVATPSSLPGAEHEMSIYAGEGSWTGDSNALRRYTLRLDGFVAVTAPMSGGELVTKPVTFGGDRLQLNLATSAAGEIRVELQDETGRPIPGFTLEDCPPLFGDALARTVTWKAGTDVGPLAGKPVRLRFHLRDADLFALQFVAGEKP